MGLINLSYPRGTSVHLEINFIISTRKLDITLSLIFSALGDGKAPAALHIKLHIFSNAVEISTSPGIEYTLHPGRIPVTFF